MTATPAGPNLAATIDGAPAPAPAAGGDVAAHRAERNRRLKWTLVIGFVTKPVALLSRLVLVPLFLRYLREEGYGLYDSAVSTAALLSLTNAGLSLGLVNRLLDCHVSEDRQLARRYLSSLLVVVAAVALAALAVWTAVGFAAPWARWLHVSDPRLASRASLVVWIAGAATLLNVVLSFPTAVYAGFQENARAFAWDATTRVAVFVASVAVVYTRWGLVGVTVATCGTQVLLMVLNAADVFRHRPWLVPSLRLFEWRLVRATFGEGIYLFALQGAVVLIFQCDKLVIGATLGAANVTTYSIVGNLLLVAYGVYVMVLGPMWSFHGEALRRGDWAWARKGMRLSLAFGLGSIGCCTAVLLVAGDVVFRTWTHGQVTHVPRQLILAVGVTLLLRVWVDCRSVLLNGAGVLLPQVIFFAVHATLNLAAAVVMARRFGVIGVAWATPLTALLTSAWGYPWLVGRLGRRIREGRALPRTETVAAPLIGAPEEPL